jgi:predicted ATPase
MLRDFKLKIDNFGPINKADLDISKINIIAGKNASGKTTLSKLLYCIITAFSTDGQYLTYESLKEQTTLLINNLQFSEDPNLKELDEIRYKLDSDKEYKLETIEECLGKVESLISSLKIENEEVYNEIIEKINRDVNGIRKIGSHWPLLTNLIKNEFSGSEQLLNNYENGKIEIYNDKENNTFGYVIEIREGILVKPTTKYENTPTTNREAIYIETPYFLDYKVPFSQFNYFDQKQYHQMLLYQKLTDFSSKSDILDEIRNEEIIKFQNKINQMIDGNFRFNNRGLIEFKRDDKTFDLPNTSTGLKSIGILQLLLENRKLKENSYLIMDEPEVHLHPEWQVKLAKILVLLVKELNVNLFINSHSPQFIEAIEVYSIKYGLRNDTKFYLTKKNENDEKYNVENIEYDNLNELYNNLGDAYDIIEEVRGENIANQL